MLWFLSHYSQSAQSKEFCLKFLQKEIRVDLLIRGWNLMVLFWVQYFGWDRLIKSFYNTVKAKSSKSSAIMRFSRKIFWSNEIWTWINLDQKRNFCKFYNLREFKWTLTVEVAIFNCRMFRWFLIGQFSKCPFDKLRYFNNISMTINLKIYLNLCFSKSVF